jgi:hypothetical protein
LFSVLLAILASVFSTKYYYAKGKASQLNIPIFEGTKAWEDDNLTQFSLEIDFVQKQPNNETPLNLCPKFRKLQ